MGEVEVELPGFEGLERIDPPFASMMPRYRVRWRFHVTGVAEFGTWQDPDEYTEDEVNADALQERVLDDPMAEVDYDSSWYQEIEVRTEDGGWKPVDEETYGRIAAHEEREAR